MEQCEKGNNERGLVVPRPTGKGDGVPGCSGTSETESKIDLTSAFTNASSSNIFVFGLVRSRITKNKKNEKKPNRGGEINGASTVRCWLEASRTRKTRS